MPTKHVLIGFLAGIGVAVLVVLVGGRFWAPGADEQSTPISVDVEHVAEATSDAGAVPVDETETVVSDDMPVAEPAPEPVAPASVAPREPASRTVSTTPPPPPAPKPVAKPTPEPPVVATDRTAPVEPPDERSAVAARSAGGDDPATGTGEPAADDDAWAREEPWPDPAGRETAQRDSSMSTSVERPLSTGDPAEPTFEELILSADSVISLQVDSSISTETALVEDRVEARTVRDVKVGSETAVPAGTLAIGSVTLVEPGGKIKERARLGIRFHTLVLDDGTEVPLQTETIYREGRSPGKESTAKIGGGAAAGAILGGIFGGRRGAIIGGAIGAGGGTAATMAGGRNPAALPAGTPVTIRLQAPATVTVER